MSMQQTSQTNLVDQHCRHPELRWALASDDHDDDLAEFDDALYQCFLLPLSSANVISTKLKLKS
jgi:hypothetical protein